MYRALLRHLPLMKCDCEAQRAILRIARRLTGEDVPLPGYGQQKSSLFQRLFRRRIKEVKVL